MKEGIHLTNVTKKIGNSTIVDKLNINVNKGEVFGLLGPNGAGKTTTIRMIVGLVSLSGGSITINGKSIEKEREKTLENIGVIVENPDLYPFMSGYKNLKYFARLQKNKPTKKRLNEIIELVGLTKSIHRKVKNYSLGMKQRLGLAQCLLHDPKVLILDEPTNGLDPSGIKEIREQIRKLAHEKNITVLVSSHLLSEMELMCDRFAIIKNGKWIQTEEVREKHQKEATDSLDYALDVSDIANAVHFLQKHYPETNPTLMGHGLQITATREQIGDINQLLTLNNYTVYEMKKVHKSLEERFLEVTEKEGDHNVHHSK